MVFLILRLVLVLKVTFVFVIGAPRLDSIRSEVCYECFVVVSGVEVCGSFFLMMRILKNYIVIVTI